MSFDLICQQSGDIPHSYYPRPQFKRDSFFSLNGEWEFSINESDGDDYPLRIKVPFCPESEASGIGADVLGKPMRYKRFFTLPKNFIKDRVLLHFGALDQLCRVYLNGVRVGSHAGGYLPFFFDITDSLCEGENELVVAAFDDLNHDYPWGKQKRERGGMWYTPVSGIWQSVWLESIPEGAFTDIKITPNECGAVIAVSGGVGKITLTLDETDESFTAVDGIIDVKPADVKKWSPESPYLYRFTLQCESEEIKSYFAIRTVDVKEVDGVKQICLNGEPYLFNGLLDQGYFPEGIYTPLSIDAYVKDIQTVKSMGFNMLRKHIKIEPMIFYYLCDSIGIAVFQDMVNNQGYSYLRDTVLPTIGMQVYPDKRLNRGDEGRKIFLQQMDGTAELLYNCPCVVYYTIFNEGWGQFDADGAYEMLKAKDATRILDTTSGWFRRTKSDVDSRHVYFKPLKPKKLSGEPLVISEFGGYSHRVEGHCFSEDNYGYKTFKKREDFEGAVVRLYENEVKPLVKKGASAFVYTQVSDVEDETNGFLTYDREVLKVDPERIKRVMLSLKN